MTIAPNFNVSEYHHVNSYGVNVGNVSEAIQFIFSAWVQICQIFDATLCSGVLILCLWIVQAFLYRAQGHGHITLQSMCNVMYELMK